jgi:hypothetical protein
MARIENTQTIAMLPRKRAVAASTITPLNGIRMKAAIVAARTTHAPHPRSSATAISPKTSVDMTPIDIYQSSSRDNSDP